MRKDKWIVTDEEIEVIFKNTNFGGKTHRQVLIDATLDRLAGWHIGYTAKQCCIEAGLLNKKGEKVTAKGKGFLWLSLDTYHNKRNQTK